MIEEKINEEVIDLEIMHKKEFKIIEGIKTSPLIKTDKNPAVLLVHGFGANKHEDVLFDEIAQILAEESILSYRFDLMKKGENNNEYIEPPLSTQRMYLKHILNYIKKQPETDISRIGILGQSLGSLATIITAGDKEIKNSKPLLKTLVLMGASSNIKDTLKWYIESKGIDYNPNEPIIIEKSDKRKIIINPNFWKDLENHNGTKKIKKCNHCSLLFVRGDNDNIIKKEYSNNIYSEALGKKKIITIKNADHGFNPNRDELYIALRQWFREELV